MSDSKGVRLASRYGYITNDLGYCGPHGFGKYLYAAAVSGKGISRARAALEGFEALYPYLSLIARRSGISDPLDERVVEAHFLGNSLLRKRTGWREDLSSLIRDVFSKRGLPRRVAESLAEKVPRQSTPHHSFHVLFLHTITGVVPPTRKTENNCLILPGKVIDETTAIRKFVSSGRALSRGRESKISPIDRGMVPSWKKGDYVSLHWNYAIQRISRKKARELERVTARNLGAIRKNAT